MGKLRERKENQHLSRREPHPPDALNSLPTHRDLLARFSADLSARRSMCSLRACLCALRTLLWAQYPRRIDLAFERREEPSASVLGDSNRIILRVQCVGPDARAKGLLIVVGHERLLSARTSKDRAPLGESPLRVSSSRATRRRPNQRLHMILRDDHTQRVKRCAAIRRLASKYSKAPTAPTPASYATLLARGSSP
jgi:hypothetical protein